MRIHATHRIILAAFLAIVTLTVVACGGGQPGSTEESKATAPEAASAPAEPAAAENLPPPSAPASEAAPAPPSAKPAQQTRPRPAPPREPTAAPTPAPAPEPEPVVKTVASGTEIEIEILDGVSSSTSQVGDTFRGRVTRDVMVDDVAAIPAGSFVTGSVTEAVSLKKIGGQAKLGLSFTAIELPSGESAALQGTWAAAGKSETGKDAATIGGAAAGGALLGRVLSKKKSKGTAIGAVVGAAAGTAIAAKTEGEEVDVPAGTVLGIVLQAPTTLTVRR